MEGSTLEKHSVVLNSIVGTNCHIGHWARVDGSPEPEQDVKGQISVTVLGRFQRLRSKANISATEVTLAAETLVRSCIVLPNVSLPLDVHDGPLTTAQKSLAKNSANQVLL